MADALTLKDETAGTIALGDLNVRRIGFGAMRIWPGISGAGPRDAEGRPDREAAIRLCRRAVERGVDFFDTADIYGFGMSEDILGEALSPFASEVTIATKAGYSPRALEPGETSLPAIGRPEHIRRQCEQSLRKLKVDCIALYQSHVPDPEVPYAETIGAFADLQREGKIRHVGVSNVTVEQLKIAQSQCPIVSVQNRYNLGVRASEELLQFCETENIAFLPYRPMMDDSKATGEALRDLAEARQVAPQQIALAWLLAHSPVLLPIPGTSDIRHLDMNIDAAWIRLSGEEIARLEAASAAETAAAG